MRTGPAASARVRLRRGVSRRAAGADSDVADRCVEPRFWREFDRRTPPIGPVPRRRRGKCRLQARQPSVCHLHGACYDLKFWLPWRRASAALRAAKRSPSRVGSERLALRRGRMTRRPRLHQPEVDDHSLRARLADGHSPQQERGGRAHRRLSRRRPHRRAERRTTYTTPRDLTPAWWPALQVRPAG
jgi:hypothetical protein